MGTSVETSEDSELDSGLSLLEPCCCCRASARRQRAKKGGKTYPGEEVGNRHGGGGCGGLAYRAQSAKGIENGQQGGGGSTTGEETQGAPKCPSRDAVEAEAVGSGGRLYMYVVEIDYIRGG